MCVGEREEVGRRGEGRGKGRELAGCACTRWETAEFFPSNTCNASLSFLIVLTFLVLWSEVENAENNGRAPPES